MNAPSATAKTNSSRKEGAPDSVFSQIADLARKGDAKPRFLGGVLRLLAKEFVSPYAALHVRFAAEVVDDDCHTGAANPGFWKPSVQRFLTESLGEGRVDSRILQTKSGRTRIAFLGAPIVDAGGGAIGAIAMVVGPVQDSEVPNRLDKLESAVRLASSLAEYIGSSSANRSSGDAVSGVDALGAISKAAGFSTPEELAFAVTNELRNKLAAELVALGIVRRKRVRLLSISGLDEVRKQTPGVVNLRAAMEECLDAGEPIVCQKEERWTGEPLSSGHRLHKQWQSVCKGDAVASIPLSSGGQTLAVLSLRRRGDQPFTASVIEDTRRRIEPLVKGLLLTQRANRGLVRHLWDVLHSMLDRLFCWGSWVCKGVSAVVIAALLWFCFGTIRYDLSVPCTLRPSHPVHVAVPLEGVLGAVHVVEGDVVKQGDVLCELDKVDVEQQRAELLAQWAVLDREKDRAASLDLRAEVQIAMANQELVKSKLAIVDRRVERSVLRSPIDGLVVSGDLRKRVGGMVVLGEPLFTLAPIGQWTAELSIAESSADEVHPGHSGSFASYARPEMLHALRVARVLPAAQSRNQKNVFLAEADLAADSSWLKPGMEGVARVELGRRPVWWTVLHRAIDYVRMNLWL